MKICGLSSGFCSNVVIYAFYVSKWTFRARTFSRKFHEFFCSSGFWAEKCRPSGKKVSAGLSNFIPTVQRIIIREHFLYWKKKIVLLIFPEFDRNCSGVILKNVRRSSGNCIFFQSSFLGNKYFLKNYEFINPLGILEKTSVAVIETCILTVLGINFEVKCGLREVLVFVFFRSLSENFSSW